MKDIRIYFLLVRWKIGGREGLEKNKRMRKEVWIWKEIYKERNDEGRGSYIFIYLVKEREVGGRKWKYKKVKG